MRRWLRTAALVAAGSLIMAACGGDEPADPAEGTDQPTAQEPEGSDETDEETEAAAEDDPLAGLIEAAQAEGSLTVYSSQEETTNERVKEMFEAQYGITLDIPRVRSGDQAQRIPAEAEAGSVTADALITTDVVFLQSSRENDLIVDLTEEEIPALADWPEEFYVGHAATFSIIPIKVTYNEDVIPEELIPEQWEDLLAPELEGRLIMADPRTSATWRAMMYLLYEEYGAEFLQGIAAQGPKLYESIVSGSEALAAGEGWIGFPNIDSVIVPLQEKGAPLVNVVVEPTSGVEQSVAVVNNAPHPNAARLFANWLLSEDGQQAFNAEDKASPLGECCGLPLPGEYISIDYNAVEEATPAILEALGLS